VTVSWAIFCKMRKAAGIKKPDFAGFVGVYPGFSAVFLDQLILGLCHGGCLP